MGGFWELPGGKIEHKESPEQAITRELNEEQTLSLTEKIQQLKPYSALLQGNLMGLEKEGLRVSSRGGISQAQEILIAQRRKSQFMGGFWELPGGKIEHKESPEQAITRELNKTL
jgi:8-oxo-dGTP pyrophosphatase MutT (NUDIX family)